MGVALYVQGYFKHPESISGQIKALGYYEVDKEAIESHKINNSFTVIHEGLNSIEAISKTFYYYGFEDAGEVFGFQGRWLECCWSGGTGWAVRSYRQPLGRIDVVHRVRLPEFESVL